MSYAIFNNPPITKGAGNENALMIIPVNDGLIACAMFLVVLVMPAAAVLSSPTTTTIYDCRVGTSIYDKAILAK